MELTSYTDLRSNLKYWLDKVTDDVTELIIKRKNKKDLVVISLEEYNAMKETAYLMKGANGQRLLESMEQAKNGEVVEHALIED